MKYGIFIYGLHSGRPSPFDHQWVTRYDPQYIHPEDPLQYDGGILETSPRAGDAMLFDDAAAAFEKWREVSPEPFNVRADGRPNRPLTAYTVGVLPIPSTKLKEQRRRLDYRH